MKNVLYKLNEFCRANGIDYVLTGTLAMKILGAPIDHQPHDIDIKVFNLTDDQKNKLLELQYLCFDTLYPINATHYESTCYKFKINDVLINVLMRDKETLEEGTYISVNLRNSRGEDFDCKIQILSCALKEKFRLNRIKDLQYIQDFIRAVIDLKNDRK